MTSKSICHIYRIFTTFADIIGILAQKPFSFPYFRIVVILTAIANIEKYTFLTFLLYIQPSVDLFLGLLAEFLDLVAAKVGELTE